MKAPALSQTNQAQSQPAATNSSSPQNLRTVYPGTGIFSNTPSLFTDLIKQSPQMNGQQEWLGQIKNSPHMVVQREKIQRVLGNTVQMPLHRIVQRLPDLDVFKERTHLDWKVRWSVKVIDRQLTAFHALAMDNYSGRVTTLNRIIQACDTYLKLPDEEHGRKDGVRWLLPQAKMEKEIFLKLVLSAGADNRKERYRRAVQAQDMASKAEVTGYAIAKVHEHIGVLLGKIIVDIRQKESALLVELIQEDLNEMRSLIDDNSLPNVTRSVLKEVFTNVGHVLFEESAPGVRLARPGEGQGKKYVMKHALRPGGGLGTAERLGSLAHELTHVSSGESFSNTSAFLLFDPNLPIDQIVALAKDRVTKVGQLETLLAQDDKTFSPKQKDLLQNKIDYAKESKIGLYAARFSDAAKAKLGKDSNDPVGLRYQALAKTLGGVAKAIPEGNSTLIEYDSVMNQMLIYMHMWGIPQKNKFYRKLRELATEARDARATAHGA